MVEIFNEIFIETATQFTAVLIPIIVIYLLFDILRGILWR